jgi:hypothetical protein
MPHSETFIDGVWYPSVTTVMDAKPKPWIIAWRQKWGILAERKMRLAAAVGTEFHSCVDGWLNYGIYKVNSPVVDGIKFHSLRYRVACMMSSFLEWAKSIDGMLNETELKVVSRKYKYSGTFDAVGTFGKSKALVVVDWKTSSRIYDDYGLQLAAYAQAYFEQTGQKATRGLIVHVSKTKPHHKVTVKEFKLSKRTLDKFLKLREMFDTMQTQEATK